MAVETITERDHLVIRRQTLAPGEAGPWHTDACHRFSVVVQGDGLVIEFADGNRVAVSVHPGLADWDSPERRVHRAINTGIGAYEEVVTYFRDQPNVEPAPTAQP